MLVAYDEGGVCLSRVLVVQAKTGDALSAEVRLLSRIEIVQYLEEEFCWTLSSAFRILTYLVLRTRRLQLSCIKPKGSLYDPPSLALD